MPRDESIERTLYRPQYFDRIVAWGGGDAINNVIRYLGPGLQLISFDPKSSISMIGPEAFKSDAALKPDFESVKSTHQALVACLVSGTGTCDSQIAAFASAQQALTTEKYKVWEGLFKGAPNASKATTFLSQMQQLEQQKHAMFQQAFGSSPSGDSPDAATTPVE